MNLADTFFSAARTSAQRCALQFESSSVSYAELEHRVLVLRSALEAPAPEHVALLASRSVTAYAGVLGILAAGHSYVPLNPSFPAERNRRILETVGARTLVVGPEGAEALRALLPLLKERIRVVCIEPSAAISALAAAFSSFELATDVRHGASKQISESAAAYVLFTSGSTGAPKGVTVRHRNVRRYLENFREHYPIHAEDRLTQTFDLTFDLSVHDQFVCWAAGACLVVYGGAALAAPLEYTRQHGVNVWFSVPSLVAHLESARKLDALGLPDLRLSLFCGEKLSYNAWKVWRGVAPQSRIVNLYGPTEATIAISHFEVPADFSEQQAPQGVVPIGRAFSGQLALPRRADRSLSACGEVGALWLSGDQLSAGYFEDPVLTAERFVELDGALSYCTGDRAARDAAGNLTFFGREDLQVKVMGYRVELGDVEHALRVASGAAEVVALLIERDGIEELVAALPLSTQPKKPEVRRALEALLPIYMRPRRYFFLANYPLNPSGKVDRSALAHGLRDGALERATARAVQAD